MKDSLPPPAVAFAAWTLGAPLLAIIAASGPLREMTLFQCPLCGLESIWCPERVLALCALHAAGIVAIFRLSLALRGGLERGGTGQACRAFATGQVLALGLVCLLVAYADVETASMSAVILIIGTTQLLFEGANRSHRLAGGAMLATVLAGFYLVATLDLEPKHARLPLLIIGCSGLVLCGIAAVAVERTTSTAAADPEPEASTPPAAEVPNRRRRVLRMAVWLALLAAVLVGVGLLLWRPRRALTALVSSLRAADEPVSLAEAFPRPAAPELDGAPIYDRAFAALVVASSEESHEDEERNALALLGQELRAPGRVSPEALGEAMALVRRLLEANAKALDLAAVAATRPRCYVPQGLSSEDVEGSEAERFRDLFALSHLIGGRSDLAQLEGRTEDAFAAAALALSLTHATEEAPRSVSRMVHLAQAQIACDQIDRAIGGDSLVPIGPTREVLARLDRLDDPAGLIRCLQAMRAEALDRPAIHSLFFEGSPRPRGWEIQGVTWFSYQLILSWRKRLARVRAFGAAIDVVRSRPEAKWSVEIAAALQAETRRSGLDPTAPMSDLATITTLVGQELRQRERSRKLRVRLAAALRERERGAPPPDVETLVAEGYLDAVPSLPSTGEPIALPPAPVGEPTTPQPDDGD